MPFDESRFDRCFYDWEGNRRALVLARSLGGEWDPLTRARSLLFVPKGYHRAHDRVEVGPAELLPRFAVRLWLPRKGECPPIRDLPDLWKRHGYRSLTFHEALDYAEAYLAARRSGLIRRVPLDPLLVGVGTTFPARRGVREQVFRFYETDNDLSLLGKDPDSVHVEDNVVFLLTPLDVRADELVPSEESGVSDLPYFVPAPRRWDPTLGPDPFAEP